MMCLQNDWDATTISFITDSRQSNNFSTMNCWIICFRTRELRLELIFKCFDNLIFMKVGREPNAFISRNFFLCFALFACCCFCFSGFSVGRKIHPIAMTFIQLFNICHTQNRTSIQLLMSNLWKVQTNMDSNMCYSSECHRLFIHQFMNSLDLLSIWTWCQIFSLATVRLHEDEIYVRIWYSTKG